MLRADVECFGQGRTSSRGTAGLHTDCLSMFSKKEERNSASSSSHHAPGTRYYCGAYTAVADIKWDTTLIKASSDIPVTTENPCAGKGNGAIPNFLERTTFTADMLSLSYAAGSTPLRSLSKATVTLVRGISGMRPFFLFVFFRPSLLTLELNS